MGFPRHLSQHVGGFVISAGPLAELVPVENAAMAKRTVIQWDKDDLESLGLLKVDVLALGMLTAIRKCFELISRHIRPFAMSDIRWEDPAVYHMLQQGDSMGVFQVESRAQTSMLPRLKPACYYDLVIQIAIVRPGPIQGDMVHPFLRRRDKIEPVTFPSAEVEGVLSRTMGVPIFQEQVIQLAMVAAGFSGGEADQLRRAMASWKRSGELEQFEHKLLQGMTARATVTPLPGRYSTRSAASANMVFPSLIRPALRSWPMFRHFSNTITRWRFAAPCSTVNPWAFTAHHSLFRILVIMAAWYCRFASTSVSGTAHWSDKPMAPWHCASGSGWSRDYPSTAPSR